MGKWGSFPLVVLIKKILDNRPKPTPPIVIPPVDPTIPPAEPVYTMPKLVPYKQFLRREDGTPHTCIAATDFQLAYKYFNGQNIEPILAQRHAIGFNELRIALSCKLMFPFKPTLAEIREKLPKLCNLLSKYKLYGEFTVFLDGNLVFDTDEERLEFFAVVCEVLRQHNHLLELVNEENVLNTNTNPDTGQQYRYLNFVNSGIFTKPEGITSSHGSNGSQHAPVRTGQQNNQIWDYENFHTNDAYEWHRKDSHNALELTGFDIHDERAEFYPSYKPIRTGERTRATDRYNSRKTAWQIGASCALLTAGSTYHSVEGKESAIFTDHNLLMAQEFVNGCLSVPLEFQEGHYRHATEAEIPGVTLRAYAMRLNDGREHVVQIDIATME